jgi:hypothetical protein
MELTKLAKLTPFSNIQNVEQNMFDFTLQNNCSKAVDDLTAVDFPNKSTVNEANFFISKNNLIKKMSYTERMNNLPGYTTPKRPKNNILHTSRQKMFKVFEHKNENEFPTQEFKKKLSSKLNPNKTCLLSNPEDSQNYLSKEPSPSKNNAPSFSFLFDSGNSLIKNKIESLIGFPKKRSEEFTNKLKTIIENKSSLLSQTTSLMNQFFESFNDDEVEKINQNYFKNKFNKIEPSLQIDQKTFKAFLKKKKAQKSKHIGKTFLSDSEQEEGCLMEVSPIQCKENLGASMQSWKKPFKIFSLNDLGKEVGSENQFRAHSTRSLVDKKTITNDKSYQYKKEDLCMNEDGIQDLGKFLYINPKQK